MGAMGTGGGHGARLLGVAVSLRCGGSTCLPPSCDHVGLLSVDSPGLSGDQESGKDLELLQGWAYTAQLGLETRDEFEIKLGRKQIKLIPLGAAEEEVAAGCYAGGSSPAMQDH